MRNLRSLFFKKYLLTTNTVSSGILMSIGDALSQYFEKKSTAKADELQKFKFDWPRNAKMFVVGAAQGPMHHYFYWWLDTKYAGSSLKFTSIKILYDQFVMSPVCIAMFFYSAGWLYDQSIEHSTMELKSKFPTVYITDWMVWPAAQFINFQFLPTAYRVIYVNFVTMMYNIFLSYVKHTEAESLWFPGRPTSIKSRDS